MLTMMLLFAAGPNADAVTAYVDERLVPTLEAWPGVQSVVSSAGPMMSPAGPAPFTHAVVATVSGIEAIAGFGQAEATADVRAEGEQLGVTVLFFENAGN